MKKKLPNFKSRVAFCVTVFLSLTSLAQTITYQWANNMTNKGARVEKDPFGYIINLNNSKNGGGWEMVKYNSSGAIVTSVLSPTILATLQAQELKVDKFGNIYVFVAMTSSVTLDIDPGPGVKNIGNGISFIKYTNSLIPIWAKTVGADFPNIDDASMTIDSIGRVCITGQYSGTVDFDPSASTVNLSARVGATFNTDVFLAKYDSAGNYMWAKSWGGLYLDQSRMVEINPINGNVLCHLGFKGDNLGDMVDMDPGPGVINIATSFGPGPYPMYFIALDANGNFQTYVSTSTLSTHESTIDSQGNFYILNNLGSATASVNKYSSTFSLLFSQGLSPGNAYDFGDICIDQNFNLYVSYTSTSAGGCTNGLQYNVHKVNSTTGASISQLFLGSPSANACGFRIGGIATTDGSDIIISNSHQAGTTYTMDYNPTLATNLIPSSSSFKGGIGKYNFCSTAPAQPGTISGNVVICPASTNVYSIALVAGATSYVWSTPGGWTGSSTTNTINLTANAVGGTITVSAINACGTSSVSTLIINLGVPTITVNSGSICSGQSFTMVPSGASTYTFSSGSAIVSPTANTSYSVTGTSTAGCVGSNTAVASVTVNSIPVASASTTQTLTCVNTTATLNGSGVSTYTWTGPGIVSGGNSATPTANMAGTYSLVGTTSGCVSNTAIVSLTSNTNAPSVSITATSNSICIGNSATLTASGASTYSWSTSSTATSIVVSPTTTTNYILIGTNTVNGCTNTINKSIGVNPLPIVTANTSNSLICGPPFQGTATITASGATTYTWNTAATTTSIAVSPSVTTSYTVTGTDANGCVNSTAFTQSVSACTGINPIAATVNEIFVYPNPFTGKINITTNGIKQSFIIYNVLGSIVCDGKIDDQKIEIDLSQQPNGIYFIRIGSVTKKIIKE